MWTGISSLWCTEYGLLRHVRKSKGRLINWRRRWQDDLLECCWGRSVREWVEIMVYMANMSCAGFTATTHVDDT